MPSRRAARTGRRPVIAAPILLALTGTSAIFTAALWFGSDGKWSLILFIFAAVTVLTAAIAWNRVSKGRQPKALDPEQMREQFPPATESSPTPTPATMAAEQAPLTGTIEGTNIQVEVGQPAAS